MHPQNIHTHRMVQLGSEQTKNEHCLYVTLKRSQYLQNKQQQRKWLFFGMEFFRECLAQKVISKPRSISKAEWHSGNSKEKKNNVYHKQSMQYALYGFDSKIAFVIGLTNAQIVC